MLAYIYLTESIESIGAAFAILFGGSMITGIVSIFYYSRRGG